jgi:hypothetical protein
VQPTMLRTVFDSRQIAGDGRGKADSIRCDDPDIFTVQHHPGSKRRGQPRECLTNYNRAILGAAIIISCAKHAMDKLFDYCDHQNMKVIQRLMAWWRRVI